MNTRSTKKPLHVISIVLGIALLLNLAVYAAPSQAAGSWPEKPVRLVIPFGAGGGSDMLGRLAASIMSRYFNDMPITCVNVAGGGGSIGIMEAKNSAADGYTIALYTSSPLTVMPATSKLEYTLDDFEVIANLAFVPGLFAVRNDSPFKNLDDLVAYAKEHPRELLVGGAGAGTVHQMNTLEFSEAAGFEPTFIPYDSASTNNAALLGGHINVVSTGTPDAAPQHIAGDFRILGVFAPERLSYLPDVPTFKELGYPNIGQGFSYGFLMKKGSPQEAIDAMKAACAAIAEDEEFKTKLAAIYFDLMYLTTDEAKPKLEYELGLNKRIVDKFGLGN